MEASHSSDGLRKVLRRWLTDHAGPGTMFLKLSEVLKRSVWPVGL